ncbi:MAG: beta-glucosidase BglX [Eubacteriales bacterium]|nr:beta-glucosidase BglX [Eubacteriales bacterium]
MTEQELKQLLNSMTRKEKVGQTLQVMARFLMENTDDALMGSAAGFGWEKEDFDLAGAAIGTHGAEKLIALQKLQMERQPHGIPMLFMKDIIHGMRTVFPAPIGQGASFDPEMTEKCAQTAAKEAAVSGLHVTFSPMADLVRDARWGRVMESTGEDPYLNSRMTAAMVKGFQGKDLKEPGRVAACVKHFAGYGAAEAGRDYNTAEISEHTFRNAYLPAYEAGIQAGAAMVMTSFNTVDGIPATGNRHLMRDILRDEMGFEGVLISDFAAILETINHGYAEDKADAAKKALEAGVDIDMCTNVYSGNLCRLIEEGKIDERLLDEAVWRILKLKNDLGLFENPFKDADPEKEKEVILCPEHRALAREAAAKSFVLLKNDGVLPVSAEQKIAFIGPYVNRKEMLSSWAVAGEAKDSVTIQEAAQEVFAPERMAYCQGSPLLENGVRLVGFRTEEKMEYSAEECRQMEEEACNAAKEADVVILALGEHYLQSGEAASRAMIEIPEIQMELFRKVSAVNPNVVVVLFSGRPLDLREVSRKARAVLEVWMPGTEGGHAIADVLTGKVNPSGKLSMSFPYCVGQVPVYYNALNTGRPYKEGDEDRFLSRYLDIPNKPLYPFGYGLSYTEFSISELVLDRETLRPGETVTASVTVKNIGKCEGTEVVQLYIRDVAASVARPVKELKDFRKVTLKPGEVETVVFEISEEMLRFYKEGQGRVSEAGEFRVFVGNSSETENQRSFVLIKD